MRRLFVLIMAALFLSACESGPERPHRTRFLRILKEYLAGKSTSGPAGDTTPLQAMRAERVQELREAFPNQFDLARAGLKRLEHADAVERVRGIRDLHEAGETGRALLLLRTACFQPSRLKDLDAMLLKFDDPAVFRLRRAHCEAKGDERDRLERQLALILEAKTEVCLQWLAHRKLEGDTPWRREIVAAGAYALPALGAGVTSSDPTTLRITAQALSEIGSGHAAALLADMALRPEGAGPTSGELLEMLAGMPGGAGGNALQRLVRSAAPDVARRSAWVLAAVATRAEEASLTEMTGSKDDAIALAGLCGKLRLADGDASRQLASDIRKAIGKSDPTLVLGFLIEHPHLGAAFAKDVAAWSRAKRRIVREMACRAAGCIDAPETDDALCEALIDSDVAVREAALQALRRRFRSGPDQAIAQRLVKLLDRESPRLALGAARALVHAADPRAIAPLIDLCREDDEDLVEACVLALSRYGSREIVGRIPLQVFWRPVPAWRQAMVRAMLLAGDADGPDALKALLESVSTESRLLGISLIDPATCEKWLPRLRGLAKPSDPEIAAILLPMLAYIGEPYDAELLRPYLKSPSEALRRAAVKALCQCVDDSAALLNLSESRDMVLRDEAIRCLAKRRGDDERKRLEAAVFEGSDAVRAAAIAGLGFNAHVASVPVVCHGLTDPYPSVRSAACLALCEIAGGDAVDLLKPLLDDPCCEVRCAAAKALQGAGTDPPAMEVLSELDARKNGFDPVRLGRMFALLGALTEADAAFARSLRYTRRPAESALIRARMWARAGKENQVLEALGQARRLGFQAWPSLLWDDAYQGLKGSESFRQKLENLFHPRSPGPGYLSKFSGPIKLHLKNGSFLKGDLEGFRKERFSLKTPSGLVSIPRSQVARLQFLSTEK